MHRQQPYAAARIAPAPPLTPAALTAGGPLHPLRLALCVCWAAAAACSVQVHAWRCLPARSPWEVQLPCAACRCSPSPQPPSAPKPQHKQQRRKRAQASARARGVHSRAHTLVWLGLGMGTAMAAALRPPCQGEGVQACGEHQQPRAGRSSLPPRPPLPPARARRARACRPPLTRCAPSRRPPLLFRRCCAGAHPHATPQARAAPALLPVLVLVRVGRPAPATPHALRQPSRCALLARSVRSAACAAPRARPRACRGCMGGLHCAWHALLRVLCSGLRGCAVVVRCTRLLVASGRDVWPSPGRALRAGPQNSNLHLQPPLNRLSHTAPPQAPALANTPYRLAAHAPCMTPAACVRALTLGALQVLVWRCPQRPPAA